MDPSNLQRLLASDLTVADKVRALAAAGYARAEIARLLGKRYQHVRNVLEGDKLRSPPASEERPTGLAEPARRFQGPYAPPDVEDRGGGAYRLSVREDGSVVLPPSVREAFGLSGPGSVIARLDGNQFRIESGETALRRIREMLKPYVREGASWVDELIEERRREAADD